MARHMEEIEDEFDDKRGKKFNHKLKSWLVLQYLLKNTDENHAKSGFEIAAYIQTAYDISAERRSIYRDIDEINLISLMLDQGCTLEQAKELLEDGDDSLKTVVYDHRMKGFYVAQRKYTFDDIRLLAECVYSAKFVTEKDSRDLMDIVCSYVSDSQANSIRHNALLVDRVKTNNRQVLFNLTTINEAMSTMLDGRPHTPEKISFKYLKHSINDLEHTVERRKGQTYVVNPFQILISEGNYYLLVIDGHSKKHYTYRVDRMKDVRLTGEERECEMEFKKLRIKSKPRRAFNMFSGIPAKVNLRCENKLLDTMVERFGTKEASYKTADKKHFIVTAKVEVSNQFFGWLAGFGEQVKLVGECPMDDGNDAAEEFKGYLDKVRMIYK